MKNTWFEETFLQSLIKKAESNSKYPNQIILSEKQADVCGEYMYQKYSFSDTGCGGTIVRNYYMEYTIDGYYITMRKKGKYYFLYTCKITTNKQELKAKEIREKIDKLEDTLDILYENKENNISEIKIIENTIDELWNDYNETLKVK